MEMKEFTQADWYGFAGAEMFADGTAPLIGFDGDQYLVIADGKGVSIVGDEGELLWTPADINHWSPNCARQFVRCLPGVDGSIDGDILIVLGFSRSQRIGR